MKSVQGRTAVITGAARGIGKALSMLFLRDGAKVVAVDIQKDQLEQTYTKEIEAGQVLAMVGDITKREQVYRARDQVHEIWGPVDILVNNAGVVWGERFVDCSDERLQWVMDVNYHGTVWMTKAFLPDLIGKREGHVVNIASAAGIVGVPLMVSYCASKYAVIGFTDALRMEMKKEGLPEIRFTVVCPSYVTTGMFEGVKAPLFFPWLSLETVTERIYTGMKRDKPFIREPFMLKLVPFLKGILPTAFFDRVNQSLGVAKSMETWRGGERQKNLPS